MASAYYTDSMREAVASIPNVHNFPLEIFHREDEEHGDFLVLAIDYNSYVAAGMSEAVAKEVAGYLIDVRNALIDAGAQATFAVIGDNGEEV